VVLDPFAGSGTVLLESARRGHASLGADINPAAVILARTYSLCSLTLDERSQALHEIDIQVARQDRQQDLPLFRSVMSEGPDLRVPVVQMALSQPPGSPKRVLLEALVVTLDYYSGPVLPATLRQAWSRLRKTAEALPLAQHSVSVALADARHLPWPEASADFVFTSPPYINVFNYHQQYRASVEALGWRVLPLARSEIGSNRKNRSNRFLTVVEYCLDMAVALAELARVCRPNGRAILVVGRESNVRKTPFLNGRILRHLAVDGLGLRLLMEQERVFMNRFGQQIFEDILHLGVSPVSRSLAEPVGRSVAQTVLTAAREHCLPEVLPDLEAAIEAVDRVVPSPPMGPLDQVSDVAEALIARK